MMLLGTLVTGAPGWVVPALLVWASGLAVLLWSYSRAGYGGLVRWVSFGLKTLGLSALAACLVEPLWSGTRAKPGANIFVIAADNSQSMSIQDQGASQSRGELLRAILTAEKSPWQTRLEQDFETRRYVFDSRLRNVADFHSLAFDGRGSTINSTLTALRERFRGRPLAGVLLFSDGNATDTLEDPPDMSGLPPIFCVPCSTDRPPHDIGISAITVNEAAFEDAPVTIQAVVRATGYAKQQLVAQVLTEEGEQLAEETQESADEPQSLTFRLNLRPRTAGISFYTVRVSAKRELDQFNQPGRSVEATLANNRRLVVVDRGVERYHVLYVSGRPNWEFKFLRRAMDDDPQVRLVGMIRVAKREPKFAFRAQGGAANPLFQGAAEEGGDETQRYDQPVLVRLNTLDEAELRDGFPKSRDALYRYHAIVLDDLEAEFFTHDQTALLRRFVSERGGGFLMLGGQESFRQGKYQRTPIEELLPVYLDRAPDSKPGEQLRLELTREGWLQPWVRLRKIEPDEADRVRQMPGFQTVNRVRGIKPGAGELAQVSDAAGHKYPALVAQRFGQGRSAALLIGDLWRWGLRHDPEDRDLEKAWRQTIRWLVSDVPERIEIRAEPSARNAADLVRLAVRVRSAEFEAMDNAGAVVTVRPPDGSPVRLDATPSLSEAGLYEAEFAAREPGPYRAEVNVSDDKGAALGKSETGWTSDPAAIEFQSLQPNRSLLEELARRTGGEIVPIDTLESFVAGLPNRKAPVTEQWAYPLWHRMTVFMLGISCLLLEWGLRRWRGLP